MKEKRNYWIHRISNANNLSFHLLENENLLSIGWSDFSSELFVQDMQKDGMASMEYKCNSDSSLKYGLSRNRWSLYRFIIQMQLGDYVVVPSYKEFSIYEITDNVIISNESINCDLLNKYGYTTDGHYIYNSNNATADIGFYRHVKPVKTHIQRSSYAKQGLTSRMKIRQTNARINDLEEEILESLDAVTKQCPICLKDELIKSSIDNILAQIRTNLDADKFEKLVEWYLESLGAKVIKTPAKNSSSTEAGDADKVAYFDKLKLVVYVQAKKHENITSDWAVKQITSFNSNNNLNEDKFLADEEDFYTPLLWVISSCDNYSDQAKELALQNNVRLINGQQFARLILENGIENLPL
jgi:predicted Mrr-cat superfamily restriction endonuclease